MALAIILGIVLGAFTIVFAMQNVADVTVAFFAWQFTGSLALILLATLAVGVVASLLIVLPDRVASYFRYRKLKHANQRLEEDLRVQKEAHEQAQKAAVASISSTRTDSIVTEAS